MKESILKALKAKFPGGNANILDRIAARFKRSFILSNQNNIISLYLQPYPTDWGV